jgi:hypothetical protein
MRDPQHLTTLQSVGDSFTLFIILDIFASGSLVGSGSMLQEGREFETQRGKLIFSIYLILPAALGPGVHSAFNTNEYQKQKNNVSGDWCEGLITSPPSVSRLSRQCGILNISRPVTGIALLFLLFLIIASICRLFCPHLVRNERLFPYSMQKCNLTCQHFDLNSS